MHRLWEQDRTYVIDNVQTNVNDTLICSVTIVDSHGESDTATTSIVIGNTVPSVTSVSISPSTITNDDVTYLYWNGDRSR